MSPVRQNINVNVGKGKGKFIGKILMFFLGIILLFVLAIIFKIGLNTFSGGDLGFQTEVARLNLEEAGVSTGITGILEKVWNYNLFEKKETYESLIDEDVEVGVRVTGIESSVPYYSYGSPIEIAAGLNTASLSEEKFANLNFSCGLDGYSGNVLVQPDSFEYPANGNSVSETVRCVFEDGEMISSIREGKNARLMTFGAEGEFSVWASYDVYLVSSVAYETLPKDPITEEKVDPFIYYLGIRPTFLDSAQQSKSVKSPLGVGIGSGKEQPFKEGEDHIYFRVDLKQEGSLVEGAVKSINSFFLRMPVKFELNQDPNFCDFKYVEQDGSYNIYGLTAAAKEKVNVDCSSLSEKECENYYKEGLYLGCDFNIPLFLEDKVEISQMPSIVVEVAYTYRAQKKLIVDIRKGSDESGEDSCLAILDEEECKITKNCEPNYSGGDFSSCTACTVKECLDYSETSCKTDYCQLNCFYQDNVCEEEV